MAAITYNLKKMMKFNKKTPMTKMVSLRHQVVNYFDSLFFISYSASFQINQH